MVNIFYAENTLTCKNNINIDEYAKLKSLLKRKSGGFKSKKSRVFSAKNVEDFLNTAPDNQYLATKVNLKECV